MAIRSMCSIDSPTARSRLQNHLKRNQLGPLIQAQLLVIATTKYDLQKELRTHEIIQQWCMSRSIECPRKARYGDT